MKSFGLWPYAHVKIIYLPPAESRPRINRGLTLLTPPSPAPEKKKLRAYSETALKVQTIAVQCNDARPINQTRKKNTVWEMEKNCRQNAGEIWRSLINIKVPIFKCTRAPVTFKQLQKQKKKGAFGWIISLHSHSSYENNVTSHETSENWDQHCCPVVCCCCC